MGLSLFFVFRPLTCVGTCVFASVQKTIEQPIKLTKFQDLQCLPLSPEGLNFSPSKSTAQLKPKWKCQISYFSK